MERLTKDQTTAVPQNESIFPQTLYQLTGLSWNKCRETSLLCTWLLLTHDDWLADWLDMKLPANVLKLFSNIRNPLTATRRDSICLQPTFNIPPLSEAEEDSLNLTCRNSENADQLTL